MSSVIISKNNDNLFGDFKKLGKLEFQQFATVLFYLAVARKSWIIPKELINNWHYFCWVALEGKGWIVSAQESIECTDRFVLKATAMIGEKLRSKDFSLESIPTGKDTFDVGIYSIRVEDAREYMTEYLKKEVV